MLPLRVRCGLLCPCLGWAVMLLACYRAVMTSLGQFSGSQINLFPQVSSFLEKTYEFIIASMRAVVPLVLLWWRVLTLGVLLLLLVLLWRIAGAGIVHLLLMRPWCPMSARWLRVGMH